MHAPREDDTSETRGRHRAASRTESSGRLERSRVGIAIVGRMSRNLCLAFASRSVAARRSAGKRSFSLLAIPRVTEVTRCRAESNNIRNRVGNVSDTEKFRRLRATV